MKPPAQKTSDAEKRAKPSKRVYIPDTPENVAKAIFKKRPKKDWKFLRK